MKLYYGMKRYSLKKQYDKKEEKIHKKINS